MTFENQVKEYLMSKGIGVNRMEGEGTMSLVFHVKVEDNQTIKDFLKDMEEELGVVAMQSDAFGMNVLIIEKNEDAE